MRRAQVFSNGVLAGMLTETDSGKYIFCYDDSFLIDEKQTAISLSFPKNQREFTSETLFPFFLICFQREQIKLSSVKR